MGFAIPDRQPHFLHDLTQFRQHPAQRLPQGLRAADPRGLFRAPVPLNNSTLRVHGHQYGGHGIDDIAKEVPQIARFLFRAPAFSDFNLEFLVGFSQFFGPLGHQFIQVVPVPFQFLLGPLAFGDFGLQFGGALFDKFLQMVAIFCYFPFGPLPLRNGQGSCEHARFAFVIQRSAIKQHVPDASILVPVLYLEIVQFSCLIQYLEKGTPISLVHVHIQFQRGLAQHLFFRVAGFPAVRRIDQQVTSGFPLGDCENNGRGFQDT